MIPMYVRRSIAASFHEVHLIHRQCIEAVVKVAKILHHSNSKYLKEIFVRLLKDNDTKVQEKLIPNLNNILSYFITPNDEQKVMNAICKCASKQCIACSVQQLHQWTHRSVFRVKDVESSRSVCAADEIFLQILYSTSDCTYLHTYSLKIDTHGSAACKGSCG
jgi:hypothetical protein